MRLSRVHCLFYVIVLMLICNFSQATVHAEPTTLIKNLSLNEKDTFVQFVVEGGIDNFNTNLILPNGTKLNHKQYDEEKYAYFSYKNYKSWIIYEAFPGDYKIEIISSEESEWNTYIKRAIDKPVTTWLTPLNTTINATGYSSLNLTWTVKGDVTFGERIRFYLQSTAGGMKIKINEAILRSESYNLSLPNTLPTGSYRLLIEADNRTMDPQIIDPNVILNVANDAIPFQAKLEKVHLVNGNIGLQFVVSQSYYWSEVYVEVESGMKQRPFTLKREQVEWLEEGETNDERKFIMWLSNLEEGEYVGIYQFSEKRVPGVVQSIPSFKIKLRDWDKDLITWSEDEPYTNAQMVTLSIYLQDDAEVQVLQNETILMDERLEKSEGDKSFRLQIHLDEGENMFSIFMKDDLGNYYQTSKLFRVDHTPPRLELIQPQTSHQQIHGNFASGYTEPGVKLLINGQQVPVGEDGYFYYEKVGKHVHIEVIDRASNITAYSWEEQGTSWGLSGIILLNLAIVGGTAGLFQWIRRRS